MIFLTDPDIDAHLFNRFSRERDQENRTEILNTLEAQNITIIKSKLKGRYDIDEIFKQTGDKRHWLIVRILTKLVVYDYIRRNAARKVPEDYVAEWKWAMKSLDEIKSGKEKPDDLPVLKSTDGTNSLIMHDNTTDKDEYI